MNCILVLQEGRVMFSCSVPYGPVCFRLFSLYHYILSPTDYYFFYKYTDIFCLESLFCHWKRLMDVPLLFLCFSPEVLGTNIQRGTKIQGGTTSNAEYSLCSPSILAVLPLSMFWGSCLYRGSIPLQCPKQGCSP